MITTSSLYVKQSEARDRPDTVCIENHTALLLADSAKKGLSIARVHSFLPLLKLLLEVSMMCPHPSMPHCIPAALMCLCLYPGPGCASAGCSYIRHNYRNAIVKRRPYLPQLLPSLPPSSSSASLR